MSDDQQSAGDDWLTVRDIATQLKVSEETVRRWIRDGDLPALTLGKKAGFRIRSVDLEAFIAARYGLRSKEAA